MTDLHNSQPDLPHERLDAYLDGVMSPAERQEFEVELAANQQLRRECELQSKIDASLGRLFVAPALSAEFLAIDAPEAPDAALPRLPDRDQKGSKKRWRTVVAVLAACIAWVVVGVKVYRDSTDDGYRQVALADIYEKSVANGFQPKWVCEDDREFAETFQKRQGLPLLFQPNAQDVMVGLSYLKGITLRTTTMLARVDGEPVLVFVDRLERDTRPDQPSWISGLKLFRQELGELVLYELTPLSEPHVLEHFYIPDPNNLPWDASENPVDEAQEIPKNSP